MAAPSFPPKIEEWLPGNPFQLEPPLPRWLMSDDRKDNAAMFFSLSGLMFSLAAAGVALTTKISVDENQAQGQ